MSEILIELLEHELFRCEHDNYYEDRNFGGVGFEKCQKDLQDLIDICKEKMKINIERKKFRDNRIAEIKKQIKELKIKCKNDVK